MTTIPYHYPPELLDLLVDALSVLSRSKQGVVDWLRGAGVRQSDLAREQQIVYMDKDSISKAEIARNVLKRINERRGDEALRARREIVKRVTEFENFSVCWPDDRDKARGRVAEIRELVNRRDTFTRINQERKEERRRTIEASEAAQRKKAREIRRRTDAKDALYSLFGEQDANKRGRKLEPVITELFEAHGITILEPFQLRSDEGTLIEQVDGFIMLDRRHFLVEAKWHSKKVGKGLVSEHLMRVFSRPEAHAIFITATDFTEGAISACHEAIAKGRVVAICTLQEMVQVLDMGQGLKEYLRSKVSSAIATKNPEAPLRGHAR